jgi:AraC-like DNA-binding protein
MEWPVDDLGIDPVTRAQRWDFHLSPAAPIYPNSSFYPGETPLTLDEHEGVEVGIVLTGQQERHFGDYVRRAGPGDVWLCAPWEPHGYRAAAPDTRDVCLIFLPEFLRDEKFGTLSWLALFAVPPPQRPQAATPELRASTLALAGAMLREVPMQQAGWQTAIRLDLVRLLFALSRDWRPEALPSASPAIRVSNIPRIMPAVRLVHSRPGRRVAIAEAAAACGLGRAQFCLVFRHTMGLGFGKFCLRARLALVADRLLNTQLPSEAIAEETGFADASHLHRTFVKHYGCTPSRYREQHQLPPGRRGRT